MCGKGQLSRERSSDSQAAFFFFPQTSLGTILLCHCHFLLVIYSPSESSVAKSMRLPPRQNPNTPQGCVSTLKSLVHGHELGTASGQHHSSTM